MKHLTLLSFLLALLLFAGCGKAPRSEKPSLLLIRQGAEQTAMPNELFSLPVQAEVLCAENPSWFGGKGERPPAQNVKVELKNAPGSDLALEQNELVTDVSGNVEFKVRAGKKIGDHYLDVIVRIDAKTTLRKRLRFTVGAYFSGAEQEGVAKHEIANPVTVTLAQSNGEPAVGVPVYFRIVGGPASGSSGASVNPASTLTNAKGEASTTVKLGEKTGVYQVGVEVADPAHGIYMRNQTIRVMGIDLVTVIIGVLGGLVFFVFGMKIMSAGLQKVAGESMKRLLQFFAGNSFVAVIAGALVTAVIQSSSTTTVLVIGFINAGLLNLTQAIGIIFGANIGTTITAQIISFNLAGLALPAIIIGFTFSVSKRRLVGGWGESMLGIGLLFFGMVMMSDELKVLCDFHTFREFFKTFDCTPVPGGLMPPLAVLGAIGIGTLATVLIQSSAAAMGIVLALAGGGLINFYTAVPLLLGTNIGTTITAFLASIAANRVAKQAALAHTLFNVIGTGIMVILFYIPCGKERIPCFLYLVNQVTAGDVFAIVPQNLERHIAMAHTLFNIVTVVLLLPFIGLFAKLCNYLLPVKSETPIKIQMLEPHLLNTPSVALEQSVNAIQHMVSTAWDMIDRAVNVHFVHAFVDHQLFSEIEDAEEDVDEMQRNVTDYLVKITREHLTEPQSALVPLLMHCTNDAERIGDHAEMILQLTERLNRLDKKLSEQAQKDLAEIWGTLNEQAINVMKALKSSDHDRIGSALKAEQKIHMHAAQFEADHTQRLRQGSCRVSVGVLYIELLGELVKISDHLTNIAERTTEIQKHYIKL